MKTCNEWMAPDLARSWQLETAAQLSISAETLLKQFCSAYKQNLATEMRQSKGEDKYEVP